MGLSDCCYFDGVKIEGYSLDKPIRVRRNPFKFKLIKLLRIVKNKFSNC